MYCDICRGEKRIRLSRHKELSVHALDLDDLSVSTTIDASWKEFDCPQCVPTVPYRRVRATKVVAQYEPEDFAKFQVPIERELASKFGQYLLREGLIRFSTDSMKDYSRTAITVTAHLGVVSNKDVKTAEATPEVALTRAPIPKQLRERVRGGKNAVVWTPPPLGDGFDDEDSFELPKNSIGKRFSGLDLK